MINLLFQELSTGAQRRATLEADSFVLGTPFFVQILGEEIITPFLSREQFQLRRTPDAIIIDQLGTNDTLLNGKPVPRRVPTPVASWDEITVQGFSHAIYIAGDQEGWAQEHDPYFGKLAQLEEAIHRQLLRKLDLAEVAGARLEDEKQAAPIIRGISEVIDHVLVVRNLLWTGANGQGEDGEADFTWYLCRKSVERELFRREFCDVATERRTEGYLRFLLNVTSTEVGWKENEQALDGLGAVLVQGLGVATAGRIDKKMALLAGPLAGEFVPDRHPITPSMALFLTKRLLLRDLVDLVFGLGPLEDLLRMRDVSEIMVVSKDLVYVEKDGVLQNVRRSFLSDETIMTIIERIIAPLGRRVDKSTPLVDARLKDGSRVNAIIPPLALRGPALTIRRFAKKRLSVRDLVTNRSLSESAGRFLEAAVRGRKNVLISGGTGSGKTTLLNILSGFIPNSERIVTIEDSAELRLSQDHVVSLETKPPNLEGKGEFTIRDLVKNALRMRPDRIIVGECRGAESLDMLQAMNTGHNGSMSTIHSNNPRECIGRLETMIMMAGLDLPSRAIREQIAAAVHVIVQIARLPHGRRLITHVAEVSGIDPETNEVIVEDIFVTEPAEEQALELFATGRVPSFLFELLERKMIRLEEFFV